jgi:hypothetical protein
MLRPDLAIVLVDCDGENTRKSRLEGDLASIPCPKVIAVAVQEFEAWLLADVPSAMRVLGASRPFLGPPEGLKPGEAKQELAKWVSESALAKSDSEARSLRRRLALECDLDVVTKTCGSFASTLHDMRVR